MGAGKVERVARIKLSKISRQEVFYAAHVMRQDKQHSPYKLPQPTKLAPAGGGRKPEWIEINASIENNPYVELVVQDLIKKGRNAEESYTLTLYLLIEEKADEN